MDAEARLRWSLLGLPVIGLASALLTFKLNLGLGSLIFGILLSAWFWAFLGFRSIRKTLAFMVLSPVAALLAIWTAVFVDGRFGIANPDDLRLYFIGGYVGAFVLVVAASCLVIGNITVLRVILQGLFWALAGGVLAVAGRIAGSDFRGYWRQLDPAQPEPDTSLIFVWHIGMVMVLGVALWLQRSIRRRKLLEAQR